MNGCRARVERHRRRLAEAASRGERTVVPRFDWLVATINGLADAAHAPEPHRSRDTEVPRPRTGM